MWLTRSLLLAGLGGLTLLLTGALSPQATPSAAPDPQAEQTLDDAIAALDPDQLGWLQMNLWEQGNLAPLTFQAEGRYLAGPEHRLRLDLQVRVGSASNRFQVVSDGRTLWQIEQRHQNAPAVTRVRLGPVLEAVNRSGISPKRREEFYRDQMFAGPAALLNSLRPGTTFTRQESVRWNGRDVLLLTGDRELPQRQETWPEFLPRHCRLFLDAHSLWLCRLEWWGPTASSTRDHLLLEIEFRDPVLGQVAPEQVFTYEPGQAEVTDLTKAWLGGVRNGFPRSAED